MNWFFSLPAAFLVLIILIYYLTKKSRHFQNLKSLFPSLFVVLFLALFISVLKTDLVSKMFYSEELLYIMQLLMVFFILVFSVKVLSFFLFDYLFSHKMTVKYPRLIRDITVIIMYIIGLLLIAKYGLNIRITEVLASAAVLTVVAGFALQDILGDLFSGIALNFEESLKIGDWVKIADHEGQIEQFRWRSIKIRTIDNVLVVIPNQIASKEAIRSFGRAGGHFALRAQIGVSYRSSPDLVIQTIRQVIDSVAGVLKEPPPEVLVRQFDDFAVVYELKYYLRDYSKKNIIHSEVKRKAWYAFKREGIEIPFPIRDVYIKKTVPEGITDEDTIRVLKSNEVLNTIDEKQLRGLLEDIELKRYGQGEMLISEGETGRYFYHILSGQVEVLKNGKVINVLATNDYFGEFSLFTGEKTTADVRVSRECTVLRISSKKFHETVKLNKNMALKLSEVIAVRRAALQELTEKESEPMPVNIKKASQSIFLRIKKYFSI